jgi:outer membrane autotransporter protein
VRTANIAAGADYRVSPDTVVGFAISGGNANFGLNAGLGSGRSDILQGGVYGATRFDSYYLSASLAASYYDVSTDRIVSLPGAFSHLTADYNATGFGGRIEGGRRFVVARGMGFTPYAALQAQTVHAPSYSEQAAGTANFALAYNSQSTSRLRSELGATVDQYVGAVWGGDVSVFGRVAWAHNFWRDASINALFQLLPVAGFNVQGAFAPENSVLVAAGGDYRFGNGWSVRGKFEAELASSVTTYSANAALRTTW